MKINKAWRYIVVILITILFLLLYEGKESSGSDLESIVRADVFRKDLYLEISKELFIALVSALTIGFLLEEASRDETIEVIRSEIKASTKELVTLASGLEQDAKTIETAVFKRLLRRNVPEIVLSTAQNMIFDSRYFRRHHSGTWTLRFADVDGERRIKATVDTDFELENLTAETLEYIPRYNVDERVKGTVLINKLFVNNKEIVNQRPTVGKDGWHCFAPQEIPPRGIIKIRTVFEILRYPNDHEIWTTQYPSDGMKLRIIFPDNTAIDSTKNEYFFLTVIGHQQLEQFSGEGFLQSNIEEVLLPSQGILMNWRFNR